MSCYALTLLGTGHVERTNERPLVKCAHTYTHTHQKEIQREKYGIVLMRCQIRFGCHLFNSLVV